MVLVDGGESVLPNPSLLRTVMLRLDSRCMAGDAACSNII